MSFANPVFMEIILIVFKVIEEFEGFSFKDFDCAAKPDRRGKIKTILELLLGEQHFSTSKEWLGGVRKVESVV